MSQSETCEIFDGHYPSSANLILDILFSDDLHKFKECVNEKKNNFDYTDNQAWSFFHFAAHAGAVRCLSYLIDSTKNTAPRFVFYIERKSIGLYIPSHVLETPLIRAAYMRNLECVQLLLRSGAPVKAKTLDDVDALLASVSIEQPGSTTIDPKIEEMHNQSQLDEASLQIVQELIKHTDTYFSFNYRGENVFHLSAQYNLTQCMKFLSERTRMPELINHYIKKDDRSLNAVETSALYKHKELFIFLLTKLSDAFGSSMYEKNLCRNAQLECRNNFEKWITSDDDIGEFDNLQRSIHYFLHLCKESVES